MKKQAGNVIEWLIIGVVLIGAVVLIAWRYIETDKAQNDAEQSADSTSLIAENKSAHIGEGVYSLAKWSLFMNIPNELNRDATKISAVYYKSPNTEADAYYLVSDELKAAKYTCEKNDSLEANGAFLVVERSYNKEPSQPVAATQKVGDYYYWVNKTLQNNCYESELMTKYFKDGYGQTVLESIRTKADN